MSNERPIKKILFIINPIAGVKAKVEIPKLIDAHIDKQQLEPEVQFTEYAGHAIVLAKEAVANGFDIVVAVGGDGSVNEVGRSLVGTEVALGILPVGSGNGFAIKANIPRNVQKAIEILNAQHEEVIDVGSMNGRYFLSCAGSGFQAGIVHQFAVTTRRGFWEYLRLSVLNYFQYQVADYTIRANEQEWQLPAFVLDVGNTGQYGYGVGISPSSELSDGWLELTMVRDFPRWKFIYLVPMLLLGIITKSQLTTIVQVKEVTVTTPTYIPTQIDGDPASVTKEMRFQIHPSALRVVMPRRT